MSPLLSWPGPPIAASSVDLRAGVRTVVAGWLWLATLLAGAVAPVSLSAQQRVDESRPFVASGSLRIMVLEGSLRIRAWDRDSVRVTGTVSGSRSSFYFSPVVGGTAKLGFEAPQGGRAELELSVPAGTTLWIKTSGAPIHVAGVTGPLDLYTVTGRIQVDGAPRSLYAESMAGPVVVAGSPRVARVKTGSGDVTYNGSGADIALSTVSGGISLNGEGELVRLTVETIGGEVRMRGSVDPGGVVIVNSHDGPVTLAVPPAMNADFLLVTLQGRLVNELTRGSTRKSSGLKGQELAFTNGSGGAHVTIRTFSGAVRVRPLDDR